VEDVKARFEEHSGFELDEEQVILVGSNPLPVVVAALALRPARGVHLVHTAEVKPRTERIAALLTDKGLRVQSLVPLNDHRSGPRIQEALATQFGHIDWTKVGLHYTGGTKPMVAQVHAHWSAQRKCAAQASYLGDDAVLRFENGGSPAEVSLRNAPRVTLAELTKLHTGIEPGFGDEHKNPKADSDGDDKHGISSYLTVARSIHAFVQSKGFDRYRELLPPIYGTRQDIFLKADGQKLRAELFHLANEPGNFRDEAFGGWPWNKLGKELALSDATLDDVGVFLRKTPTPANDKKRWTRRMDDAKWLWSNWLEVWLADVLERARDDKGGPLFHEVHQNVTLEKHGVRFFEADVVAVRGHRAFLFSCTVDKNKYLVKSKLFEAAQRTTQLGGDHARFAVVSFHSEPDKIQKELEENGWDGYDTARCFGSTHVASADVLLEKVRPWVLG
jgi:hypothetical protein